MKFNSIHKWLYGKTFIRLAAILVTLWCTFANAEIKDCNFESMRTSLESHLNKALSQHDFDSAIIDASQAWLGGQESAEYYRQQKPVSPLQFKISHNRLLEGNGSSCKQNCTQLSEKSIKEQGQIYTESIESTGGTIDPENRNKILNTHILYKGVGKVMSLRTDVSNDNAAWILKPVIVTFGDESKKTTKRKCVTAFITGQIMGFDGVLRIQKMGQYNRNNPIFSQDRYLDLGLSKPYSFLNVTDMHVSPWKIVIPELITVDMETLP